MGAPENLQRAGVKHFGFLVTALRKMNSSEVVERFAAAAGPRHHRLYSYQGPLQSLR